MVGMEGAVVVVVDLRRVVMEGLAEVMVVAGEVEAVGEMVVVGVVGVEVNNFFIPCRRKS